MSGDITLTRSELELIVSRAVEQALLGARKDVPVEVAEVARDTLVGKPTCAGKRKDGKPCQSSILVGLTGHCRLHQGQAYKRTEREREDYKRGDSSREYIRAVKAGEIVPDDAKTAYTRDLDELKGVAVGTSVPVTRTRKEINRALHYVGYKKLAQDGKVFTYVRDDGRSLVWDRSAKAITLKA